MTHSQKLPKTQTTQKVLDKGFVSLIDCMGNDLTTVNAARVSYGKQKTTFDEKDEALIKYLVENQHTSPMRHAYLTFHIKAPIFVLRQWMKHRVASDFNELSGRYSEFAEDDFYVPEILRKQATVNKQGSEGIVENNANAVSIYLETCKNSMAQYKQLLSLGVCREQARCVLPLALYSEVYWTVSLQAVVHFLKLRKDSHAQWEIQQYANVIESIVESLYPISSKYLLQLN